MHKKSRKLEEMAYTLLHSTEYIFLSVQERRDTRFYKPLFMLHVFMRIRTKKPKGKIFKVILVTFLNLLTEEASIDCENINKIYV